MFNISTRLLAHASWRVFPSSLLWSSCIPHQRSLANQWAKRSWSLREIESYNRGFFGGAVGVVDAEDNGEFSVAIRSGVFDGEAGWIYAGCGVVEGSDPREEFNEIDMKFETILSAFQGE